MQLWFWKHWGVGGLWSVRSSDNNAGHRCCYQSACLCVFEGLLPFPVSWLWSHVGMTTWQTGEVSNRQTWQSPPPTPAASHLHVQRQVRVRVAAPRRNFMHGFVFVATSDDNSLTFRPKTILREASCGWGWLFLFVLFSADTNTLGMLQEKFFTERSTSTCIQDSSIPSTL